MKVQASKRSGSRQHASMKIMNDERQLIDAPSRGDEIELCLPYLADKPAKGRCPKARSRNEASCKCC